MDKTTIVFASALDQARWIRQGEISPLELDWPTLPHREETKD
ncbi:MAG: hypothetical protein ACPGVO_23890 [Spirulinaceae cyanobacterium]